MLITRETDYALRILRALSDRELHSVGELCASEDVPKQFAYKIIQKLSQAELIESTRGAKGGCRLVSDLKRFTLYDLIKTIDPDRYVTACIDPAFSCDWKERQGNHCAMHLQLSLIQRDLDRTLQAHTLHEMLYGPLSK